MNKLLFVDDHPLYREGFRRALGEMLPGMSIEVAEGESQALEVLARDNQIDLCLADQRLGDGDGLTLLQAVGQRFPTVARGLLCADPTDRLATQAARLGCVACLSKERDMKSMAQALELIFSGGTVFDANPGGAEVRSMSDKRIEILQFAADGLSNKEIGLRLGVAERTVKDHWAHIFEQLGVANRAEAVGKAYRVSLLQAPREARRT